MPTSERGWRAIKRSLPRPWHRGPLPLNVIDIVLDWVSVFLIRALVLTPFVIAPSRAFLQIRAQHMETVLMLHPALRVAAAFFPRVAKLRLLPRNILRRDTRKKQVPFLKRLDKALRAEAQHPG